jgi:disease resistance protein RPM1
MCRYFVVIDDIWDVDTWDVIKHAFPMNNCSSRVITTTRIIDVAETCRSSFNGHVYNIRPLDIVRSRQLFRKRLFNSEENCPSYLEDISDQILEKCAGLPLAIIAISGLLANTERREDLWDQVKDSIGRALVRNHIIEGMMKILSLSYFDLPHHLKTCLLYVSIWPEDSIIRKKDLIRRWIAEGIIHKEGSYTTHEIGEVCFTELLNRNLIQPGNTNEYGEVNSCRVHDMILDFIISKSIEENFVTLLGVPTLTIGTQTKIVRRLSLEVSKQGYSTLPTKGLVLSHVRSLNVLRTYDEIPSLEDFRHLRVLELKNCNRLKGHHLENILRFFQLRYLSLKHTIICELPEQIGRLKCLEILDLRDTEVKELPASIVNLGKLSHLFVDRGVKFPDGIVNLQALETLKGVTVSKQPLNFIWGIGQLNNLRNLVLHFEVDSNYEDIKEEHNKALVSSLCKLGTQNLRSLTIWKGSNLLEQRLSLVTLERLITRSWCSAIREVPKWVSSLKNLQQLVTGSATAVVALLSAALLPREAAPLRLVLLALPRLGAGTRLRAIHRHVH